MEGRWTAMHPISEAVTAGPVWHGAVWADADGCAGADRCGDGGCRGKRRKNINRQD